MDLGLTGHAALVTGSSAGVGAAVAARLAGEGCRVLVHGRRAESAREVVEGIERGGGSADVVLADLTEPDAVATVAGAARDHDVDIVVANVGPFTESDWDRVDVASWLDTYRDNVATTASLISTLLPQLRKKGWGRVVTIGARGVVTPQPNLVEHTAAKAAVVNMTVGLAQHLAGTGVTANCVSPGIILTPGMQQMFLDRAGSAEATWTDELEAEVTADYAANPTGRLGRPEDIAAAVAFLAGTVADYVNNVNLRVDGGITGAI